MKATHVRTVAALATLLALSACGGKASFEIRGVINGLNNSGLVLANNGDTVSPPVGATSFSFPKQAEYGDAYEITIKNQPAHMTCGIGGGSGTAGQLTSISATVNCSQNRYTIGGKVVGLTAGTVVLANGSDTATKSIATGTTDFVFDQSVEDGKPYGVTVLTQPDTLFCTVANGTDVMGEANRTNIVVTCVPK